ncbi:MAG TPA: transposase [Phototrophicaceae bacterium]|nr:transposase [Phototrophicaceae bacterium]
MPLVPIRLLIINRQLDFAITVKKSLEQIGGFEVAPFTASDTALEYLRTRPHDLAMIDFTIRGVPGVEIIARVRAIQPDIAIIVTPKNAETMGAIRDFALQEAFDTPIPVRQLVPIIQRAIQRARETLLPDTAEAPSLNDSQGIKILPPELSPVQKVLDILDTREYGTETIEVDMSDLDGTPDSASEAVRQVISVFDTLAAEEPPLPGVEEHGTLHDLREKLLDSGERVVVELLHSNQALADAQPLPPDDGEDPDEPVLARKILEGTLDHTSPLKPLIEEVAPDSPSVRMAAVIDARDMPFAPESVAEPPVHSESLVTASAESSPTPPPALPEIKQGTDTHPGVDTGVIPAAPEPKRIDRNRIASNRIASDLSEEAKLAQMAVDLTQASLESTAEATLISRSGEVIAYAGKLAQEDIDYLKGRIAGDRSADETQSRIKFINLPGSGKDYMLFSRHTEGNFTLTMVFAGNMPLRVIRRQSDKLLAALSAVPESNGSINTIEIPVTDLDRLTTDDDDLTPAEGLPPVTVSGGAEAVKAAESAPVQSAVTPVYTGALIPYTFIWLLRDPDQSIPESVAQAIIAGLDNYLAQQGWTTSTLRVYEDYIYLFGAVPADLPANQIIQDLKQESAQIATSKITALNPETLWADSYYALMPGRELNNEEIQRFIRFGRMH